MKVSQQSSTGNLACAVLRWAGRRGMQPDKIGYATRDEACRCFYAVAWGAARNTGVREVSAAGACCPS